ncbi:hypothetical protein EDD11_003075 [Mortierella claussenii]|nr:hypothetical protein EDD11_003075 [Mortierella claussenii]
MATDITRNTIAQLEGSDVSSKNHPHPQSSVTSNWSSIATASGPDIAVSRSRREIVALDGFMFDSSVLRDDEEEPAFCSDGSQIAAKTLDKAHDTTTLSANNNANTMIVSQPMDSTVNNNSNLGSKKKTLSTSSISSASSMTSSSSTSSTSCTFFDSNTDVLSAGETRAATTHDMIHHPTTESDSLERDCGMTEVHQAAASPLSANVLGGCATVDQEVQIETEDPSHLFWVPFHMHPEIAPNEYNKWLTKHGVDSSGSGSLLAARKESLNRRKSVLSAQYNPEDDDEDDDSEEKSPELEARQDSQMIAAENNDGDKLQPDFLSGVFSVPLEQMGEPPVKTKTLLRRSSTHVLPIPRKVDEANSSGSVDSAKDMAAADLAAVKRGSGLTRHGPSLLRRSARTKIRRNSIASNDIRNDASRLRSTPVENGDYPAVTLVDPGPLPLLSSPTSSSAVLETATDGDMATTEVVTTITTATTIDATTIADSGNTTPLVSQAQLEPGARPLKRFVSTLRDPSKPTITTYVEPQLLEQRQKEIEEAARSSTDTVESSSFIINTTATMNASLDSPRAVEPSSKPADKTQSRLEGAVVSKVTYPIPPPVKLTHNLLQQPMSPLSASSKQIPIPKESQPKQSGSGRVAPVPQHPKKSLSWSWLWGKEKGIDRSSDRLQQGSSAVSSHDSITHGSGSAEATVKKQSTLSLLFSRNGKASSKVQSTNSEVSHSSSSNGLPATSPQEEYLNDPSRMPIHIERAIYRLSHVKLADPRRPLHEQVLISNMMFWYLGVIQQQQLEQQQMELQQAQSVQETTLLSGAVETMSDTLDVDAEAGSVRKMPHQDSWMAETKVEGSEHVVPQQDGNSHPRSPSNDPVAEETASASNTYILAARGDVEYDEESMIGGGFDQDKDWFDDEADEEDVESAERTKGGGAGPLYLQSSSHITFGYKAQSMQSGPSSACPADEAALAHSSRSRRPGAVSVS